MANEVANAGFYADFGALTSLGKQAKQNDPQAIREAARQFESLFTGMMLKSMRAAKLGDGMGDSQESDFYQDMYDQQLAVQMSQGKGLGLAEMLVQQLTRAGASGAPAGGSSQASSSVTGAAAQGTLDGATAAATSQAATSPPTGAATMSVHPAVNPAASQSTTSGKTGASLQQRIGFIQKIAPYARRAATALGVSVDTLIAQAALETGWGQHVVQGGAGASSNNLFGVKAGGAWQGTTASATTTEYSGGSAQHVAQAFRSYASVEQGVNDYVSLLQGRAAYAGALGSGADTGAFASALQHGGYATDPDYVSKLVATSATVRSLRAFKLVAGVPIQGDEQPG